MSSCCWTWRHLHPSIRAHAKKCQVQLLYIPVHLTRVLQPADTHLFAQFKAKFASLYREKKSVVENGAVSPRVWLEVLRTTLKTLLPSVKWKLAFAKVGVLNRQRELSARTLSELGWELCRQSVKALPMKSRCAGFSQQTGTWMSCPMCTGVSSRQSECMRVVWYKRWTRKRLRAAWNCNILLNSRGLLGWNRFCVHILVPIPASAMRAFDAGDVARGDGELEAPSRRAEAKFKGCCKGREGLAKPSRPAFEGRLRHARCRHVNVVPFLTLYNGCYRRRFLSCRRPNNFQLKICVCIWQARPPAFRKLGLSGKPRFCMRCVRGVWGGGAGEGAEVARPTPS